jgi:hypothetical protein
MTAATAQTEPLTEGQKIVAAYEGDAHADPHELAQSVDVALALEYERGKQHGADDRRMIERRNQEQGREVSALKSEIAQLKLRLYDLQHAAR